MSSSLPSLSSLPLQIPIDNHFSMPEFDCSGTGTSDGDLQSVVRGFTNGISTTVMDYPQTCFSPLIIQQDDSVFSATFPDLFETNTIFDELEGLYKPFYPILNDPFSPQTVLSSSSISGSGEERELERVQEKEAFSGSPDAANSSALRVKYKRRKTQHKRVVLEVAAEGVSSDVWAWRKYGQKPIKGSPYPRSYYRCSSLKGCLARKQVERSQVDPQMFIITYTAEHCHGQPTRKSSLAGTTRHKFSLPKSPAASNPDPPISPSSAAIKEDEILERGIKKQSKQEEEEEVDDLRENNGLVMCDMVFCDDDFLLGFEELDRLIQC